MKTLSKTELQNTTGGIGSSLADWWRKVLWCRRNHFLDCEMIPKPK